MLKYLEKTPAWKRWNESVPINQKDDWQSYQSYWARVDQTLTLLDILWPQFIEREGRILRKSALPENWPQFRCEAKKSSWSDSDIEYVINHVHVADLFLNDPDYDQIEPEVYAFLAHTIADLWRNKLNSKYPTKAFVVAVLNQCEEPEVYFHLTREEK